MLQSQFARSMNLLNLHHNANGEYSSMYVLYYYVSFEMTIEFTTQFTQTYFINYTREAGGSEYK